MFGLEKRGPARPFTHADNRMILKADPSVQIQWSEVETGQWRAVCQCGSEDVYEEPTDRRVRLDPQRIAAGLVSEFWTPKRHQLQSQVTATS
jgi:hypothetical protein